MTPTIGPGWKLPQTVERELMMGTHNNHQNDNNSTTPGIPTPLSLIKIDCEGCELHFLKGAQTVIKYWKPVLVMEIQDDVTRSKPRLGGQQMIRPAGSRQDVLDFILRDLGYQGGILEPLPLADGSPSWDYLVIPPPPLKS
eukprot:CAMPEP_0172470122 /NCGR_PEP_ID=MMETSP1065-20121228/65534_1 /TAXON_ID=265537 /ORGANISM="Amphiprora paludosa, Strain CCMP125" /LENGTH=140 /DNA_ID=CAMNT_0013227971 /DNA_START=6 /DNA_END=428 /DNA_ORIENTATION=-